MRSQALPFLPISRLSQSCRRLLRCLFFLGQARPNAVKRFTILLHTQVGEPRGASPQPRPARDQVFWTLRTQYPATSRSAATQAVGLPRAQAVLETTRAGRRCAVAGREELLSWSKLLHQVCAVRKMGALEYTQLCNTPNVLASAFPQQRAPLARTRKATPARAHARRQPARPMRSGVSAAACASPACLDTRFVRLVSKAYLV